MSTIPTDTLLEPDKLPLVSIVMATYNGIHYIPKQLDSLLAQTYPKIEIIITDDASTDGTRDLLQAYAENHKNIHLLLNEINIGYVKNFEKGMLAAHGELIAPSDQDDIWAPEKIEKLVAAMGNEEIIYCNSILIDNNDNLVGKRLSEIKRLVDFKDCLNYIIGGSAPGHAMLIRKKVLQDAIPLPTMIPHDHWLGFVATFTTGVVFRDEVYVRYRQHTANVFGAVKVKDEAGKKVKRKITTKRDERVYARERIRIMYEKCPDDLTEPKKVLKIFNQTYQSFSIYNNWLRMITFFKYRDRLMAYKRRNAFRKWLFCLKMFFTIK